MKLLLTLSLLALSLPTFALTCKSDEKPEKALILNSLESNLVEGKIINESLDSIFVGTLNTKFIKSTYSLFNQVGEPVTFILNKNLPPVPHCRFRSCDYIKNKFNGTLIVTGKPDEYFTCL